jgi:hypothetical protein
LSNAFWPVNTGSHDLENHRTRSHEIGNLIHPGYEEAKGNNCLVKHLLNGTWDDEFVVVFPGHKVALNCF